MEPSYKNESAVNVNWCVFIGITNETVLHVTQRNTTTENQMKGHKTKRGLINAMFDWVGTVVSYQIKKCLFETECSVCVLIFFLHNQNSCSVEFNTVSAL